MICKSESIALGADPSRVRVVYDGIDAEAFYPGPRDAARDRVGRGARRAGSHHPLHR